MNSAVLLVFGLAIGSALAFGFVFYLTAAFAPIGPVEGSVQAAGVMLAVLIGLCVVLAVLAAASPLELDLTPLALGSAAAILGVLGWWAVLVRKYRPYVR